MGKKINKDTDVIIRIFDKSLSMHYVFLSSFGTLVTFLMKQLYFLLFYPNTLSAFKPNIYMEWVEINPTNKNNIHIDQMMPDDTKQTDINKYSEIPLPIVQN